jgi:hypothetical protein
MRKQTEAERLELVRKLLAQAESTSFPEEARTFYTRAQELMTRWAIDDAMLAGASAEAVGTIGVTRIQLDANEYRTPKVNLLHAIAMANSCRVIRSWSYHVPDPDRKSGRRRVMHVDVVGYERDRALVELVWTSLLAQAEREFLAFDVQERMREEAEMLGVRPNQRGGFRIRWHNTFMMGFISGVSKQLAHARRRTEEQAKVATPGVSIVLADRRAAVDADFEERYPSRSLARTSAGNGSARARAHGRVAGERADVGRPRVGGNRPALGP